MTLAIAPVAQGALATPMRADSRDLRQASPRPPHFLAICPGEASRCRPCGGGRWDRVLREEGEPSSLSNGEGG